MNCTSALTSMFFALDLPPGSEIMAPSYTFFATILPMRFFGYVPIFVDSDPRTCCFDLEDAKKKLTPRTKAMIPMHAWGMPCEMDHITDFAKQHGLMVIEDAAQAHGASMQGKKVGTWGAVACFSFQTSKVLPSVEGGMGVYQTRELFERATAFGHYEAPPTYPQDSPYRKYEGTGFGQKYRMHPFAAAVALKQLESLDERNALVEAQVRRLNDRLLQLPGLSEPRRRPDQVRAYYYANMLFLDEKKAGFSRETLVKALKAEGVPASVWIYPEQHKFSIYSEEKWWHHKPNVPRVLPGCEQINRTHLFVPLMYQEAPELIEQYASPGFGAHVLDLSTRRVMDNPDTGTVVLRRVARSDGVLVSLTSLSAPKAARKAYEKGLHAAHAGKWESARARFEKAVALYPQYAEASTPLNRAHAAPSAWTPGTACPRPNTCWESFWPIRTTTPARPATCAPT
jgi:perosamine synthetase